MLKKLIRAFPYLLLALVITFLFVLLEGYVTIEMMEVLDTALAGQVDQLVARAPRLLILAVVLVPIGILDAVTSSFFKKQTNIILKKYYIQRVFDKHVSEFQKENNAKYLSAITNDFNTLEMNLINGIYLIGNNLAMFLTGIWLTVTVDRGVLLMAMVIIGVNLVLTILCAKPTKKVYKERSDLFDDYTAYIKEVLSAFHIVKNYNLQSKVTEDYYDKSEKIQQKGYIIERMLSFIYSAENFLTTASIYGIILMVGYLAVKGEITAGDVLLVVEGVRRMTWPLFQISESLPKLFTSGDLIKKIEDSLENSNQQAETISLPEFQREIEFKDVAFQYEEDERLILSDVNLTFKKNGKYLIVGPSGGGKSTLLKLFRKYFDPTQGEILVDGYPLKDIKREDYYLQIANIEQQVFIFEDTVRNNLTLYKEHSEEEILQAIRAAGLEDFISNLPQGLDTMLYDNGKNISGGERSRIVIARALLNKASILLMDEAFASLDMERAREIERTILSLKDITVINVSHVIFKDTQDQYDQVIHIKQTATAS